MKIKRPIQKRFKNLPGPELLGIIESIVQCPEQEIASLLSTHFFHPERGPEWPWPKSDLLHWIDVLDRFDTIMGSMVRQYNLFHSQSESFEDAQRILLLHILKFEHLLLDNSSGRSHYSSVGHLTLFLSALDLQIVEATIHIFYLLAVHPTHRHTHQKLLRPYFRSIIPKLESYIYFVHIRRLFNAPISELLVQSKELSPLTEDSFKFHYYSLKRQHDSKHRHIHHTYPGLYEIILPKEQPSTCKNFYDAIHMISKEHSMPDQVKSNLAFRLFVLWNIRDSLHQFVSVRSLVIGLYTSLSPHNSIPSNILSIDPDIFTDLPTLIGSSDTVSSSAILAISSAIKVQSITSSIMNGLNISSLNNPIISLMNRFISQDFVDVGFSNLIYSYFQLLSTIMVIPSGPSSLLRSGIIPLACQLIDIPNPTDSHRSKLSSKAASFLDNIVYTHSNSSSAFFSANGISLIQQAIHNTIKTFRNSNPFMNNRLKVLLKFVMRLVQSVGTQESLRNVSETLLPSSIKSILENPDAFGSENFALASLILSTIIHNEPTCLSILQEHDVPQALLRTLSDQVPISSDILTCSPHVIGALCLNTAGLEMVLKSNALSRYFSCIDDSKYITSLRDELPSGDNGDIAIILGSSFEELVRHQPSLKQAVLNCIIELLDRIPNIQGNDIDTIQLVDDPDKGIRIVSLTEEEYKHHKAKEQQRDESHLVQVIGIVAIFLEMFFQTAQHCKDFLEMGGLKKLIGLYGSKLDYHFGSSKASYHMSHLIRHIGEIDPDSVVSIVLESLGNALLELKPLLTNTSDSLFADWVSSSQDNTPLFQKIVHAHALIGLLSDIYCSGSPRQYQNNDDENYSRVIRSRRALLVQLGKEQGQRLLTELNHLYCHMVKEFYMFRSIVSMKLGHLLNHKSEDETHTRIHELVDPDDERLRNSQRFVYLLSQISSTTIPLISAIGRFLTCKKVLSSSNIKQEQITEVITAQLIQNIRKHEFPQDILSNGSLFYYLSIIFSQISVTLFEELKASNSTPTSHILAHSFIKYNGFDALLYWIEHLSSLYPIFNKLLFASQENSHSTWTRISLNLSKEQSISTNWILDASKSVPLFQVYSQYLAAFSNSIKLLERFLTVSKSLEDDILSKSFPIIQILLSNSIQSSFLQFPSLTIQDILSLFYTFSLYTKDSSTCQNLFISWLNSLLSSYDSVDSVDSTLPFVYTGPLRDISSILLIGSYITEHNITQILLDPVINSTNILTSHYSRLHILALMMYSRPKTKTILVSQLSQYIPLLTKHASNMISTNIPYWSDYITPILLILEACISYPSIDISDHQSIYDITVRCLSRDDSDLNLINASMRILVSLAKKSSIHFDKSILEILATSILALVPLGTRSDFLSTNPRSSILHYPHDFLNVKTNILTLWTIFIRHLIEQNKTLLQYLMIKDILEREKLIYKPSQEQSIESFIKNHSHLILRDLDSFLEILPSMFHIRESNDSRVIVMNKNIDSQKLLDSRSIDYSYILESLFNLLLTESSSLVICILLHTLTELFISYPFLSKFLPKDFDKIIHYILDNILLYPFGIGADQPVPYATLLYVKSKFQQLYWSGFFICSLFHIQPDNVTNREATYDHWICFDSENSVDNMKSRMVDIIIQSWKSQKAPNIPNGMIIEYRYGRWIALADLINKILHSQISNITCSPINPSLISGTREHSLSTRSTHLIAKYMIEKGLLHEMSITLSRIDHHHPYSQSLIRAIFRPIELLTRIGTKLKNVKEGKEEALFLYEPSVYQEEEDYEMESSSDQLVFDPEDDIEESSSEDILSDITREESSSEDMMMEEESESEDIFDEYESEDDIMEMSDSEEAIDELEDEYQNVTEHDDIAQLFTRRRTDQDIIVRSSYEHAGLSDDSMEIIENDAPRNIQLPDVTEDPNLDVGNLEEEWSEEEPGHVFMMRISNDDEGELLGLSRARRPQYIFSINPNVRTSMRIEIEHSEDGLNDPRSPIHDTDNIVMDRYDSQSMWISSRETDDSTTNHNPNLPSPLFVLPISILGFRAMLKASRHIPTCHLTQHNEILASAQIIPMPEIPQLVVSEGKPLDLPYHITASSTNDSPGTHPYYASLSFSRTEPRLHTDFSVGILCPDTLNDNECVTPFTFSSPYSLEPFYFSADYYKNADVIRERIRMELRSYVQKFGLVRLKSSLISVQQLVLPYILDDDTVDAVLTEIGSFPINKVKHAKNAEELIEIAVNFYFDQMHQWAGIVHSDRLSIMSTDRRWYQECALLYRQDWISEMALLDTVEKLNNLLPRSNETESNIAEKDTDNEDELDQDVDMNDNTDPILDPISDNDRTSENPDDNPDPISNDDNHNDSSNYDNNIHDNPTALNNILYITPEMDVSVLEALPEDVRRDVLREYFLERRRNNPNPNITLAITPEFLDSISNPEIRELVLRMETQERERYQSSRMTSSRTDTDEEHEEYTGPSDIDIASFMATLDPGLRETVLLEQDESFLAMLPPALAAEATNLRDRARRLDNPRRLAEFGRLLSREIGGAIGNVLEASRSMTVNLDNRSRPNGTSALEASRTFSFGDRSILSPIESISTDSDILDLPSLFSILRTIFHVPVIQRRLFFKLLSSICEHSLLGKELLFILLVILNEEPSDYQQLDSMLNAYLTGRMKKENHILSFLKHVVPTSSKSIACIALSILDYLLSRVESTVGFFIEPMKPDLNVFSKKMERRDKRFKQFFSKNDLMNSSPVLVLLSLVTDVLYSTSNETIQGLLRNLFYISSPSWTINDSKLTLPSFIIENLSKVALLSSVKGKSYHYLIHILQNIASKGTLEKSIILEQVSSLIMKQIEKINQGNLESSESLSKLVKASDELLLPRPANNGSSITELVNAADFDQGDYDKIFQTSQFQQLWNFVDKSLNDNMTLIPLLEAIFIICKYYLLSPRNQSNDNIQIPMFIETHKDILNTWIRNDPNLIASLFSSFSIIIQYSPNSLDFDNKRTYFKAQLHKKTTERSSNTGTLQVNVRRAHIFEDSYHQLMGRNGAEIKYGRLSIKFYDEEGIDAGGVAREWFSALSRQMFNPDYALFRTSAVDRITYQPNRASYVNPDHQSYFQFIGRIIGKAIYDGRLLDCYFTRSFYKHILSIPVDYKDMEAVDPSFYNSLVWILENDITDVLDLTFSTEMDDFGVRKIVDLKSNGRNIQVIEANKGEYVKLVTEMKLTTAIKSQLDAFLKGFHEIIPANLVSIFNEQELELLISGLPDIDIDDWRNNTEYHGGYNISSSQVVWFWRAVRSFDQELRAKLLQFATGTSKVPLEGFCALQGSSGVQKFQIHKDYGGIERLPTAHTCFNQLDIPEYESYEQLRKNLLLAMNEGNVGFGFA